MIDCKKLKLAHDLAEKLQKEIGRAFTIDIYDTICIPDTPNDEYRYVLTDGKLYYEIFNEIDDLITKLQELLQINPTYKICDDEVVK